MPESRRVLYRCRTPTNFLCPCGAVARKLKKLDLDYRTERVAQRRGRRPEIVELTRQNRVPVLVDGEEVIHDSRRIREYLDWAHGEQRGSEAPEGPNAGARPGEESEAPDRGDSSDADPASTIRGDD